MDDAEYVFNQTVRERKVAGYGAYKKKRRGGKYVRLPSDSMTRGEKRKMNGEVKSYKLGEPMSYGEFKGMPKEMQEAYLVGVQGKFPGVSGTLVAEMMGVHPVTMFSYINSHGLRVAFSAGNPNCKTFLASEVGERFLEWAHIRDGASEKQEEPEAAPEAGEREEAPDVVVGGKTVDMNNIATLLAALAGTGAKLTIEITL